MHAMNVCNKNAEMSADCLHTNGLHLVFFCVCLSCSSVSFFFALFEVHEVACYLICIKLLAWMSWLASETIMNIKMEIALECQVLKIERHYRCDSIFNQIQEQQKIYYGTKVPPLFIFFFFLCSCYSLGISLWNFACWMTLIKWWVD